ncbi:hypothetical protein DVH24_014208 [Malus domestica]|uniref:Uncharacterized protein n=1 Tax=Malus domestica TaxID=3750 RepID=A0A498JIV6_MALDO|nr:hypothetical protein DVH24_014208 [Malus domestica]
MEHDHIDHFMVPNNVEGIMDERQHMTRRAQAPKGINRPRWAPNGIRELMKFNEKRQSVEPPHTVARFSRPFNRASNMDRAWRRIKKRATSCRKNRKILQINHTTRTKTFAQIRHEHVRLFQEQVNGSKSNCITLFKLTHTRKNGEPVDARSTVIIDDFNTNMKLYEDRNEIITNEVRHIVYADVLGPERNNRVRGFGTRVVWSDVPGICREVEAIRASYEEQRKAANIEIKILRMVASEREERQMIESANVVAQLRKEHTDSMVAPNRWVDLENMKHEMKAEIMSALKKTVDGGMVEPYRVDVTQVCVNRIEQGTGLEIQASGEVEDDDFVVLQNIDTDDVIRYRPCMVNVTGISK